MVLGMNRNIACSRSSQDWPSVIGVSTRRQNVGAGGRL
jgi:hypothetical protein